MKRVVRSKLFLKAFPTIVAPFVLVIIALYLILVPWIRGVVADMEEENGRNVLDGVYELIRTQHEELEAWRRAAIRDHKRELRNIVSVVESYVHQVRERVVQGRIGREAAQEKVLEEIRHLGYGNNDYVYVANYDSVLISHPDPELHKVDFSEKEDIYGNLIVPPQVKGAREHGEGFHRYWWRRLGEDQPVEKLSYYRHFPEWNWVIGTGVYIDDVKEEVRRRREEMIQELRDHLKDTRIANTGYVYLFNSDLKMLIHPNDNIEGANFADLKDPKSERPIGRLLKNAAQSPSKRLVYKWDKPSDPGNYVYEKISWVRYFKPFDWYIASSVYMEELRKTGNQLTSRIIGVSLAGLLVAILASFLFLRRLTGPITALADTAQRVGEGDLSAKTDIRRDDEIGVLAEVFNAMVNRLRDQIDHLEQRVNERTREIEKANQELEAANQRLVELDQLKSGFLSSVSHELRTPLTSIRGFAQLIGRDFERSFLPLVEGDRKLGKKGERVRENLEVIQSESERLARLVNDVLDLAKIESGRMEWQDERLDPAEVVQQALQAGQGAFEDKPAVVLESEVAEGLPTVVADRDRVVEVLVNLVNNAAKFTEQGRVEVAAFPDADGWLRIEVRDTGSGFPPEQAEQLFDKFQQARQGDTLEDKPKGTGLGLAISREIVEHYGGRIWAESQPGVGSTFTLVLPPAMAESGPARERPAAPAVSPGSSGREPAERETGRPEELAAGSAPLILVVDDSTPVCNYLEQLLQDQGYRTLTAGDGRAALHEAHRHRPDLITMDLAMPGMDGRAVIAELRRDPELASIPIIVVSALADRGNTGADFTLGKPVDEGLLLESLRLLLEARSSSGGQSEMPCLVLHERGERTRARLEGTRLAATEYCPVDGLADRMAEGFQGMVVVPTDLLQEVDTRVLQESNVLHVMVVPGSDPGEESPGEALNEPAPDDEP